ncbi:MAG: hypothetical protein COY58_03020 [Gammaproteobacteria bacterium CG_4_10_14_0_8_um_filter_38_16]|nr:MAG: hypothetical protein COY58_03020 [Gammaproteobacteria bacterium CG_4_10_14_0_8_um_filter_38_16]PJA03900.1 MAG: hypothetical protein COX72_03180 [Gammaproteobacteria bacterium CG_4_10_14_0_2_um_filter_38_22]PJB09569.1 MAG: hypothetical protein CO120_09335 [Gammaproteobacteria bacterium CG_4_9_14_3_um_filter_38_9]
MKRNILFGLCIAIFALPIQGIASQSVFPGTFKSSSQTTQDCSVASDIVSAFCAKSGAGSFSAAVQGCCPLGPLPMKNIYNLMLAEYGTLQAACTANARQYGGTVAACVGQWTCYWNGGASEDMSGECDGNGQACDSLT